MARDVLLRSMQIAAGLGLGVGAAVLAVNAWLPTVFTSNAAVAVISSRLLRLLAYFMVRPWERTLRATNSAPSLGFDSAPF